MRFYFFMKDIKEKNSLNVVSFRLIANSYIPTNIAQSVQGRATLDLASKNLTSYFLMNSNLAISVKGAFL